MRYAVPHRVPESGSVLSYPVCVALQYPVQEERDLEQVLFPVIDAHCKLRPVMCQRLPGPLQRFRLRALDVELDIVDLPDPVLPDKSVDRYRIDAGYASPVDGPTIPLPAGGGRTGYAIAREYNP